jgi:dGTPase
VLGAFTKYPCPSFFPDRNKSRKSQRKFGFFDAERGQFAEVAAELGLVGTGKHAWCRHPLAFLVEAADDICYSIIDLEDGCRLGLVTLEETIELLAPIVKEKLNREKLANTTGLNEKLGVLRAMAIGELIDATIRVFGDREQTMLTGTFDDALTELCEHRDALKRISEVSVAKIYHARHVVEIEAAGHEVLPGLLEEFVRAGSYFVNNEKSRKYHNLGLLIPDEIRREIEQHRGDTYMLLRNCVDFISGMTDRHALSLYRKIKGISLS